ncbi:MAG TPA: S-layer homology domain-containing protein [Candidatus Rubrimentiphilum sp.]|nr:S-layer homology domain-containing protein [Candidatus Rubrimentiphilum sp.]
MYLRTLTLLGIAVAGLAACSGGQQSSSSSTTTTQASPAVSPAVTAAASPAAAAASTTPATPAVVATATGTPSPTAAVRYTDIGGIFAENAIKQEAALGAFGKNTGGKFNPYGTVRRAEYVRWLVTLNNVYYSNQPDKQIRLAEANSDQTFVDVPKSNPDFKYIQGMANSGFLVGIDKNHFAPDRSLTREEMIAILISRDANSAGLPKAGPPSGWNYNNDYTHSVDFTDRDKISKPYWGAFQLNNGGGGDYAEDEVKRIYGNTKIFYPQKPVTRAEAALALQKIDYRTSYGALGLAQ